MLNGGFWLVAVSFTSIVNWFYLDDGSAQVNIWGANWLPLKQAVEYESIINIRPSANNRSMAIQDPALRQDIYQIVQSLLGNV